jgi:hypothetical protein
MGASLEPHRTSSLLEALHGPTTSTWVLARHQMGMDACCEMTCGRQLQNSKSTSIGHRVAHWALRRHHNTSMSSHLTHANPLEAQSTLWCLLTDMTALGQPPRPPPSFSVTKGVWPGIASCTSDAPQHHGSCGQLHLATSRWGVTLTVARSRRLPGRLPHYSQSFFQYILHLRQLVWALLPPRASTLAVLRVENSRSCLPCNWAWHSSALFDAHRQMRKTAPHGVLHYILSAASYLESISLPPVQPRATSKGHIYSQFDTLALGVHRLTINFRLRTRLSCSYAVRLHPLRRRTSCASEFPTPPSGEHFAAMRLIAK